MNNPLLAAVWAANPDRCEATLARRLIKLSEELGEVSEAYLNVTSGSNAKAKSWDDFREELIDLMIVTMDCLLTPLDREEAVGLKAREAEIERVLEVKLEKWRRAMTTGSTATL